MRTATLVSPPVRSTVPGISHICFRACFHMHCLNARHQQALPCRVCGQVPPIGATVYITRRGEFMSVEEQLCAACYERRN
jgi:hypothetical protein